MRVVYQRLDDDGNVIHEEIDERVNRTNPGKPYGSMMRLARAHRVIANGRVIKDNRGTVE